MNSTSTLTCYNIVFSKILCELKVRVDVDDNNSRRTTSCIHKPYTAQIKFD